MYYFTQKIQFKVVRVFSNYLNNKNFNAFFGNSYWKVATMKKEKHNPY